MADNQIFGDNTNNTLPGTPGRDLIYGYAGDDVLDGGAGDDVLYGGAGNDTLYGGEGNDQLTGGEGADYMDGGNGNDTYYVDNRQDVVVESSSGGTDTVVFMGYTGETGTNQGYTLRENVEVLRLFSNKNAADDLDLNGRGNSLGNSMVGNAGDNQLFGLEGNDSINGGAGNDTIHGGTGNDILTGGDGIDLVSYKTAGSGVTVSLATTANQNTGGDGTDKLVGFENLEGSSFNDSLTGDSGANKIFGGAGDDFIRGGAGNDDLTGGVGSDTFRFEGTAANGVDTIRGFETGSDTLEFLVSDGYSATAGFTNGSAAVGEGAQFVYDSAVHTLYYDADGAGGSAAVKLATFAPVNIADSDIVIV